MNYIKRTIDNVLQAWANSYNRKPLLLRGARQVGKTSAVRNLGKSFENYVEIDLNERTDLHYLFDSRFTPQQICDNISVITGISVIPGKTLLLLDEIQSCPDAINKLRYFYEKYPEQHIIATGSLLEFALEDLPSFGVGRVESVYMYPFSFNEFTNATGNVQLSSAIEAASIDKPLHDVVHAKANELLRLFLAIGGMPEVVATYVNTQSLFECQKVLSTLVDSYKDDFVKYRRRINSSLIADAWLSVAEQGQGKFIYSRVNGELRTEVIKRAVETLVLAGLVLPVVHTSGNGLPLGAEVNRKYTRMIMLDTGIAQKMLGLNVVDYISSEDTKAINRGALAEQFVGQEIIKNASPYSKPSLYCWHREEKDGNAEIDYLIERDGRVLPIEVKAGTTGSMQSLRYFMKAKKLSLGVRTSLENFSKYDNIEVVPLYAWGNYIRGKNHTL